MKNKTVLLFLIFDIFIIIGAFIFSVWLKPATKAYYLPAYSKPFSGFFVLWMLFSILGHKYQIHIKDNFREIFTSIIRINLTCIAVVMILLYIFDRFSYSRLIVLGTIGITTIFEILFAWFYQARKKYNPSDDDSSKFLTKPKYVYPHFIKEKKKIPNIPELKPDEKSIKSELKKHYLIKFPELFTSINEKIPLNKISNISANILNTHTLFNIENLKKDRQLFINLHRTNDLRRINRYFIEVNKKLIKGGYFVGCVETLQERHRKIFKLPFFVAYPIYFIDFIFNRFLPKLPLLKVFYFFFTRGEKRAISKAETLGRLSYCGFQIISASEIDNILYYICRKYGNPRKEENPSYGPFIKLRRVGKDHNIINTYKVRTMHPYSEYLQDYIHEQNELKDSGKFQDDFRITGWGKIFRKLWIDELPQFIKLFRGEISLVGVRALSEHYFNLYPKEIQNLRIKFKPGLVPPYYADIPKSFEEILASEKKYLMQKEKNPYKTDFKYFFLVWWNIIFKHARSA